MLPRCRCCYRVMLIVKSLVSGFQTDQNAWHKHFTLNCTPSWQKRFPRRLKWNQASILVLTKYRVSEIWKLKSFLFHQQLHNFNLADCDRSELNFCFKWRLLSFYHFNEFNDKKTLLKRCNKIKPDAKLRCRAEKAAEDLFCSRDCFLLKVHKFLLLRTKSDNKCSSITPTLGSYQSVCFTRIMRRCFAVPSPGANNKIAIERTPTVDITNIKIIDCRYYNISTACTLNCFKVSDSNNSDVRGFLLSSWPLHNFFKWHVFRSIPPLTHHEFGKW